MVGRTRRLSLVIALLMSAPCSHVSAQEPAEDTRPLFLAGFMKSRPLHAGASIGALVPVRPVEVSDDFGRPMRTYRGVIAEAAAGIEGYRLAAGWGYRARESGDPAAFGDDIMATWFRTRGSSHGTTMNATYAGVEVGHNSWFMPMARFSVGVARRVSGPEEFDRTIFTGSIGFHFVK